MKNDSLHIRPPHANYKLVFEDQFDGNKLDEKYWNYRVGERLGGLNLRENVELRDSRLVIRFDYENIDGHMRYTGGGIVSKPLFGYGYYEAKGKLWGKSGGLHSSFWSMGKEGDGIQAPSSNLIIEIDGYEVDSGKPTHIGQNVHYYVGTHKTVGGYKGALPYETIDASEEEFVFGYEWLPNQINWYLNGELIRSLPNPSFYGPQNVWLTALGSDVFDEHIDTGCLPGESSWDYFRFYQIDLVGVNLVVNPGFEYNKNKNFDKRYIQDMGVPLGWYKGGCTPQFSYVHETKEAFSGECVLRHDGPVPFQVETWVEVPFLPEAAYTFSAMVRNPRNGCHFMKVIGAEGEERTLRIPATQGVEWQQVVIEDIQILSGVCKLVFASDSDRNTPLEVDEVAFVQTTGMAPHIDLAPYPEEASKEWLPLGEILVDNELPGSGYEEVGAWLSSGLPGFVQGSRYAAPSADNYAVWKPHLTEAGSYKVSFYNICYDNRAEKALVELIYAGGRESRWISQQGESGWIELGTYDLEPGDYVKLTVAPDSRFGNLAADTVKFEPPGTGVLRETVDRSCIVLAGYNGMLVEGRKEKLDRKHPDKTPILQDGILLVPAGSIAVSFGAGSIRVDDAMETMEIFYSDYMIRFRIGSRVMNVHTQDMEMAAAACIYRNQLYVPFQDLARAFRKEAMVTPEGLGISSDFSIEFEMQRRAEDLHRIAMLFQC